MFKKLNSWIKRRKVTSGFKKLFGDSAHPETLRSCVNKAYREVDSYFRYNDAEFQAREYGIALRSLDYRVSCFKMDL